MEKVKKPKYRRWVGLLFLSDPSFHYVHTHIYTHSLSISLTAELKMEILRERELRESIEKQMMEDQRSRGKLFTTRFFFFFSLFHSAISLNIKLFNGVCMYKSRGVGIEKKGREREREQARCSII